MTHSATRHLVGSFIAAAVAAAFTTTAHAGDGVIEINHDSIIAAGGYPYVISAPGSYKLTANLTLPDENTSGIAIAADGVTLDLNGFEISGPCTGGPPCSPTGTGLGIAGATSREALVKNGTVRGAGSSGVALGTFGRAERLVAARNGNQGVLVGDLGSVQDCRAYANGSDGVATGSESLVDRVLSENNRGRGISAGFGTQVHHSAARSNSGHGISCSECVVTTNSVWANGGVGINALARSLVKNNVINSGGLTASSNTGYVNNNIEGTVTGGIELGTNICNGNTTCP